MIKVALKREFKVNWVSRVTDLLLLGMVVGPPLAPFLAASGVFLFQGIASIIYFMGDHVCPQPDMGLDLAPPLIMPICMRCYGTVTGLLITRVLYSITDGSGGYWLSRYGWNGAILSSLLMMAYPLEFAGEVFGFWGFNNYVITVFGLITGLAWGFFTMPLLHGSKRIF